MMSMNHPAPTRCLHGALVSDSIKFGRGIVSLAERIG
jgi:hypothetical protein